MGARVVISGRDKEALEKTAAEVRQEGGKVIPIAADVTDYDQMVSLANRAAEYHGGIDTWIHAAAVMMYAPLEETKPEEFKRMVEVNLLGQVYGAMAALPHIRKNGGSLIHISSVEATRSLPLQSAYAASKHGMVGFLDALRMELEKEGAPVNVVNIKPAGINTPLYDKALTRIGVKPRPVPPVYEPEEVAKAIAYAATNKARDITVGGAGKSLALAQRLSPHLADKVLQKIAFDGQHTDLPKSSNAPNNMFKHIDGFDVVHGSFGDESRKTSLYTGVRRSRLARMGIGLAGLLAAVGVFYLAKRSVQTHT
jgi:NAD(P)-dependent dehydrogenase (short-subunit alcohol dehydrogenase family)